ncbi:hypothetical protein M569_12776, partial [Genlisea aurea]
NIPALRWRILRRALLTGRGSDSGNVCEDSSLDKVSRRGINGFGLIPCHFVCEVGKKSDSLVKRDGCYCYTLPLPDAPKLFLHQRLETQPALHLRDSEFCNQNNIDNTGLICQWPSEEVLAYYSLSHPENFRGKRVIELGSGYGLAGLVIAMVAEASEVVISDGNRQVVDYVQSSIEANSASFGDTKVISMVLHWGGTLESELLSGAFDVIVASDCTFWEESHAALAGTIGRLLKRDASSEAMVFSPKRGDKLDKFLVEAEEAGLKSSVTEVYDVGIRRKHESFCNGGDRISWPNYEPDHCYPLLI